MAALTTQRPTTAGTALTLAAAAGAGDTAKNPRGRLVLEVRNGGGAPIDVTLTAQQTSRPASGSFPAQTVDDIVVTVAAGATKLIGPVPTAYVDPSTGDVEIGYSSATSVTVAALELD